MIPVEYFVEGPDDHWLEMLQCLLPSPPAVGDEFSIEGEPVLYKVKSVTWVLTEEADFDKLLVLVEGVGDE